MARDLFHNIVKQALIKDGWTITHDPLKIPKSVTGIKLEIDLGLERIIVAEKEAEKIAVEVKSFLKASTFNEFHSVLGQYLNYLLGLKKVKSSRVLYLAMPQSAYNELSEIALFEDAIKEYGVKLIIFEPIKETIIQWIK
ncbi:MAG: fatty-acid oxidation protein subunit alpha [Saprospiraceae bacterium]|nr:fatty-acid oxidation protein subunit alpha [Saprospiraceae bacterium]